LSGSQSGGFLIFPELSNSGSPPAEPGVYPGEITESLRSVTMVVKELGIRFVVCESMARIYLRNCVGLGIYPILCKGVSQLFEEGDKIEIDTEQGALKNPQTGRSLSFKPLSETPLRILQAGGIIPILKKITEGTAP
jgi:3-isopropylmalate dehydratase small subunit